jgi:hypothetical protein
MWTTGRLLERSRWRRGWQAPANATLAPLLGPLARNARAANLGEERATIDAVQDFRLRDSGWRVLDRHEAELQELRRTVAELGPARGGSSGKSATIFLTGLLSSVDC